MTSVGARARAYGWQERTGGGDHYVADVRLDVPILVGKILRSPHPHALIRSIDVRPALGMPGVEAVVTAADLPVGARYLHHGSPYSDRHPLATDRVRFVGEEVAAVAAATPEAAEEAITRIRVRYKRLPAPLTIGAALLPNAPTLHERSSGQRNVSQEMRGEWGSIARARENADVRVEGTFTYPRVAHACMETNSTLARWDENRELLELWTSTQSPYYVIKEVANALGIEREQVICREVAVGGGFGSKSKIGEHEVIAAALAMKARQPVRIVLSREEEFAATKPRHAFRVELASSSDRNGQLCAIEAKIDVDNGAYNHHGPSVMKAGVKALGSIYQPQALTWKARLIDTALTPGGQFRGYGHPQVIFALESQIDELARTLGMDPIDFRIQNSNEPGSTTLSGARLGSVRLRECLEAVRVGIDWDVKRAHRIPGRGVGVAVGQHHSGSFANPGSDRSQAGVDLLPDGTLRVRFGGSDPGTGQRSILAQICAEVLSVSADRVLVEMMDTERTPFDMGAWSSQDTHMGGHAVRRASEQLRDRLLALGRQKFDSEDVGIRNGRVFSSDESIAIEDLVAISDDATAGLLSVEAEYVESGLADRGNEGAFSPSYSFAAHAVEVQVDTSTGEIRILNYVAAHDVGTPINPTQVEGQIIGGVAMGLGASLGEELIYEDGHLVNSGYINYALPRANDLPDIIPIIVEGSDPAGPYGAKSVGEVSIIPVAAAVANAVYDATGIRLRELPFTPDKVIRALMETRNKRYPPPSGIWKRPTRWWIAALRFLYPRGLHAVLHRWGTLLARRRTRTPIEAVAHPTSVHAACAQLNGGCLPIGGGTDVLLQRSQSLTYPRRLVSLANIAELSVMTEGDEGWTIGAGVTLDRLEDPERGWPITAVAEATRTIASSQVRRVATVGGNLLQAKRCWFYRNGFDCYKRGGPTCPCYAVLGDHRFYHAVIGAHRCQAVTPSDLATALMALDGVATVVSERSRRHIPMSAFYKGPGESQLADNELLESIVIPRKTTGVRSGFEKLRLWEGDFAVVSVAAAALIDKRRCWHDVRIVLGSLAPAPWRARKTEVLLEGREIELGDVRNCLERELAGSAHPLAGNAWKLEAAVGLTTRLLDRLNQA